MYKLGATETRESNRVYLNLRTGKLSETSKEERPGFKPFTTKNVSGTEYHFFAKTYEDLTVFIKDIVWEEHDYEGKKIVGWKLILDGGDKEYALQINSSDRPYQTLMNLLPNVDFTKPVRIVAFMGKDQKSGKPQKVLLLTQNMDTTAKDWVKPAYEQKWLSTLLQKKIAENIRAKEQGKQGVPLTDEEKKSLAYDADGKYDPHYPYIKQNADGTWAFNEWTNFLIGKMNDTVIPAVRKAAANRGEHSGAEFEGDDETGYAPSGFSENPPEWSGKNEDGDSEIPF